MSKFRQSNNVGSPVAAIQNAVSTLVKRNGEGSSEHAQLVFSAESLHHDKVGVLTNVISTESRGLEGSVKTALEAVLGAGNVSKGQMENLSLGFESAAMIMAARGNLGGYTSIKPVAVPEGVAVFQPGVEYSTESYDRTNMTGYVEQTITWNVLSARQDDFNEAFWPTIVATPDQSIFMVNIDRTLTYNGYDRINGGKAADFKRRPLLDAVRNHEILLNSGTLIAPFKDPNNNQNAYFTAETITQDLKVDQVTVPSAPLRPDTEIDLIGLSNHPLLLKGGVLNEQDALDPAVKIRTVYLKATKGADTALIAIDTSLLPSNQFFKTPEGDWRDMLLNFKNDTILLTAATQSIANIPAAPLAGLTGKVHLELKLNGDLNAQSANITVGGNVAVKRVYNAAGVELPLTAPDVTGLTFTFVGYDVEARRTNSNHRTRGILVEQNQRREGYVIPLQAPVTYAKPKNTDANYDNSVNTEALINTTRVQTNNAGVTHLFTSARAIKAAAEAYVAGGPVPQVEGLGRELIKPYYRHIEVDMEKVLNSVRSSDKLSDIQGFFTTLIGQAVAEGMSKSGYWAAVAAMNGGVERKPTVIMGTDQVLPQYLMVQGDDRTVGPLLKPLVVQSPDERMEGKIFVALRLTDGADYNPLNFGMHIWIPELVSEIQMIRGGSLSDEVGVQRRNRHVNNCQWLIEIDVTNLDKVTSQAVEFINNPVV